ncbi:MAG: glycosyltransferase family 39 protein [candidate division SR1 bacterium]|nr:glycosyltransferase family 39 protein [candidate division SR1 bacterium]
MFIINFLKKNLIACLIFISALFFLIYLRFDNTPPHWDAGRHYYNSSKYWEWLNTIFTNKYTNVRLDAAVAFFRSYLYYPPFVYWISLPFQAFFGSTYQASLASNFVWILTLGTFANLWLKRLSFDKIPRFIALAFLLGSPFIIGQSREFQVDLPLLSMLIVTFWSAEKLLQKFDFKNVALFSFIFRFGLMTKWSFGLFVLPIIGLYAARFIYLVKKYRQVSFSDISFAVYTLVLSIFGICSLWYLPNIVRLKLDLFQNSQTAGLNEGDPQGLTIESFIFYVKVIVNEYLWLPWLLFFAVIFGFAILTIFKQKDKIKSYLVLNKFSFAILLSVFNFVLMYLYLMKQGNKDTRYAIILYPSLIVFLAICSQILVRLNRMKALRYISLVAGVVCIANLLNLSLPLGNQNIILAENSSFPITVVGATGYTNTRIKDQDWGIYKALEKAKSLKNVYIDRDDSCVGKTPWYTRPSIGVDFDPQPLHTNFGTVWGLSEEYGLQIADTEKPCFILIGRSTSFDKIDTTKYDKEYHLVSENSDWQGFNNKLMMKK